MTIPPTGKTKDRGWQVGVRKTFSIPPNVLWEWLTDPDHLTFWLNPATEALALRLWSGEVVAFPSGMQAQVTTLKPYSHVRMKLERPEDPAPTLLQVRVIAVKGGRSTLAFHHELLRDEQHREAMKAHWEQAIQRIQNALVKA